MESKRRNPLSYGLRLFLERKQHLCYDCIMRLHNCSNCHRFLDAGNNGLCHQCKLNKERLEARLEIINRTTQAEERTDAEFNEIMESLRGRTMERCVICLLKHYVVQEEDPFLADEPDYPNSILYVEFGLRPSHSHLPNAIQEWLCSLCVQIDYEENYEPENEGYYG